MKAAWIRNFWTKTVAFLLAAALVPVILTYVVGLVYSYGGMGRDFYMSNLCLNAVGKKTWEICDDYIAMEGGNYELDKIYSKGDSYSNIRFRVTDEQDKVEFSNVSDGDTFCYSTVYVDKTFDVYLVKGLPAQDDIYWAKVFYDKAENWGQNALELLILFGALELFLLIFLARTAARREDGELQGGWQEKIPFDLYLLVDGTIIALLCVAVEEVYSYVSFYTPPYDVVLLGISFALAVLVFAAWVTFCARVKVGGLWKGTLIYKVLCLCWKIVKWCWGVLCAFCRGVVGFLHAIPLVWRTVVGCFIVGVMICLMADQFYYRGGQLIAFLFILSIAVCLFSIQLRKLQKEGEALAAGNLDAQVDTKWMYWDVKRHAENLNSIGDGMAAAIDKQLKSELVWRTVVGCFIVGVMICLMADQFYYRGGQLIAFLFILSIAVCLFSIQLRKLQKEGEALAAGNLDAQVDTKWMYWDVKRHAENLNSIGDGMAAAIDKQLKSERLKTELITNVSHDIKTPLTSIINYVDLLQHEHTPEQEEEYLAVLKRQAFKLKKLTEDLVEASKATTGNLPVNAVRCSMNELLSQVEGEYGDKLSAAELTLVSVMPDKELFCNVDGALMWRVIDNLLSNICKYAQNGTRVYLTLERTGGDAVVTFKNTSRAALNIPAEELMERFVRGDSSRSTEGNGLGLSIAQSLTELQGGKMSLAIDGDLFKAILRFPTVV